jgi:hypothetical protein
MAAACAFLTKRCNSHWPINRIPPTPVAIRVAPSLLKAFWMQLRSTPVSWAMSESDVPRDSLGAFFSVSRLRLTRGAFRATPALDRSKGMSIVFSINLWRNRRTMAAGASGYIHW